MPKQKENKKARVKGVAKLVKAFLKEKTKSVLKNVVEKKSIIKKKTTKKTQQKKAPEVSKITDKTKTLSKEKKIEPPKTLIIKERKTTKIQKAEIPAIYDPYLNLSKRIAGPKYFFRSDIPDNYGDTYINAIPRDPEWVFVYWEISESSKNQLKNKIGEFLYNSSKRILRLYDITEIGKDISKATSYFDIEINEYANNWYIRVPEGGKKYIIELGILTSQGNFFSVARSNIVNVPRFGLSSKKEEYFEGTDELLRMSGAGLKRSLGSSERNIGAFEESEQNWFNFGGASGSGGSMFGFSSSKR